MRRSVLIIAATLLLNGCAGQPSAVREDMTRLDGPMPADLGGSWERDYARGDEISGALHDAWYRLSRSLPDLNYPGGGPPPEIASRQMDYVYALARLAETISRSGVLTISQNDNEILIEREDDFALTCAFYNGSAKAIESPYGAEICGWDGDELISSIRLPDGMQIEHRFAVSPDRKQLRVILVLSSRTARVPFVLSRYYRRFERPAPDFNCVETLSMKRVCSTGDIGL